MRLAELTPEMGLPATAYTERDIGFIEDEVLWSREWIAIGQEREIPSAGDLLPYTVGFHGIHVQRQLSGAIEGRFNKAQHGGCRVVPAQCQMGSKTKCSYTSCGYSLDRPMIPAAELDASQRYSHQYLGVMPERLMQLETCTWNSIIFVRLRCESRTSFPFELVRELVPDSDSNSFDAEIDESRWMACEANWKVAVGVLAQAIFGAAATISNSCGVAVSDKNGCREIIDAIGDSYSSLLMPTSVCWHYPNLIFVRYPGALVSIVVQPTATTAAILRVAIARAQGDPTSELKADDWSRFKNAWCSWLSAQVEQAKVRQSQLDDPIACAQNAAVSGFESYMVERLRESSVCAEAEKEADHDRA